MIPEDWAPDDTSGTLLERMTMKLFYFIGRVCDKMDSMFKALFILIIFVSPAFGDGRPVYERKESLCLDLGYAANCEFDFEKGSYIAELTVTVDENANEPGAFLAASIPAGHIQVRFPHLGSSVADIFIPVTGASYWGELVWIWFYEYSHPCLTVECVSRKQVDPGNYDGVSELNLVDLDRIESKLPFQMVSDSLLTQVQSLFGTKGMPVVTKVKSIEVVASNTDNESATIIKAIVIVKIAKYAH